MKNAAHMIFDDQGVDDLKAIMATRAGRRFVWRLLGAAGTFTLSYTGNADTNFNEGRRSLGTELYGQLHAHCLEQYLTAMREAQQDAERDTRADTKEHTSNG